MENLLIITAGILLGCLISISWFAGSDAPYVATKYQRIRKALKLAGLEKGEVFYELGSGDGRVVIEAAKMGAHAFGVEQSLIRVWMSRLKVSKLGLEDTHFIHGDVFKQDLSAADVIFIFLLPKGVEKLEVKLKKELKKGTRVITQTFHFKSLKPYRKSLITDRSNPNSPLGKNKVEGDFWFYRI